MSTSNSTTKKILDKLSAFSFFLGFVSSKIAYLPISIATPFLSLISLSLYLSGYSIWFCATHFYPHVDPKYKEWYGFAPLPEQNAYAAFIGIFASLTAISAIAVPFLAVPAAWMFVASNLFWVIGEYHKLNNPPTDPEYSESRQKSYLSYAISIMGLGIVGALSVTLLTVYPLFTIQILLTTVLVSIGIGVAASGFWFDFNCADHKPTTELICESDYSMIKKQLKIKDGLDNHSHSLHSQANPSIHPPMFLHEQDESIGLDIEKDEDLTNFYRAI